MLYQFKTSWPVPALLTDTNLMIEECFDIETLSTINKISTDEVKRRFANDNKAFVAYVNGLPAAFGWSAARRAFISELDHDMVMPPRHKYLWNFRTLENFRGRGIYPQLLQHILRSESHATDRFWILHAPENSASQRGILKAGFRFVSKVSVKNLDQVIVETEINELREAESLGFTMSMAQQASCWACSSPFLNHKRTECCCTSSEKACNENLFIPVS